MVKAFDVKRLRRSMEFSYKRLQPFRAKRTDALKQYVGFNYSDDGTTDRVPVNLLELFISVYRRQLAAGAPQVMVSTRVDEVKPYAADFEIHMNEHLEEIDFNYTLSSAVLDALFTIGIVKVGNGIGEKMLLDGEEFYAGQSFAECVHLDDWCHDMAARKMWECEHFGNRYRLDYDEFMESPQFKNKKNLKADEVRSTNVTGDQKAETLSRGQQSFTEELVDHIDLWDFYLPKHKKIVTIAEQGGDEPVSVIDWNGPDRYMGPYHELSYGEVPGNTMPLAPRALMMDLHDLVNMLFRKLGRQAERQKTILGYQDNAKDDAQRVIDTADGGSLKMNNPTGAKEFKFGGADPATMALLLQAKELFVYLGGNLDALGGLSPQAKTLGQDELLHASANQRISEMQDRTVEFAREVVQALGSYELNDPTKTRNLYKPIPGSTSNGVNVAWTPEHRAKYPFSLYDVDIQPFSMQHSSPGMKLQAISNLFTNFYAPFAPMMMQQGKSIDFDHLNATISKLGNLPEIDGMIISLGDPNLSGGNQDSGGAGPGGMAPTTTRKYERTSRPGATSSGHAQVMSRILSGAGVQPSEAASLTRSVG